MDQHTLPSLTYFKAKLIAYVTEQFLSEGDSASSNYAFTVTIDSPAFNSVIKVQGGQKEELPENEHGEADFAMWHHCIHCQSNHVVIVSSDTDTWVYGLGIYDTHLHGKSIYVQRGSENSFINIGAGSSAIIEHNTLSAIPCPALTITALYNYTYWL